MSLRTISGVTALVAAVFVVVSCGGGTSSSTTPSPGGLSPVGAGLMGPPGLQATVYTQGLPKASAFAFDPQGRLWVATAAYSDDGTDGVYLVAATGATPVKVIASLHTPLGLLWYQQSLYVASKERVDAYSGFDGTQFAEHRGILALLAGVGEVNGIVLSPDGRIVMGISASCDHCTPTLAGSAAIVSFQPDGSDLRIDASRIRAPVGITYYPDTSDLFVTMNQRDDLGDATPGDWLSLVQQGQDWGFPDCYGQGGDACIGVPARAGRSARQARGGGRRGDRDRSARPGGGDRRHRRRVVDGEGATGNARQVRLCLYGYGQAVPDRAAAAGAGNPHAGRGAARRRLGDGDGIPDCRRAVGLRVRTQNREPLLPTRFWVLGYR